MQEITVRRYSSIEEISPTFWDSIVDESEIYNSHAYLAAVEQSEVNQLRFVYYTFHRGEDLVAHVSVAIFVFGLDIMIQGAAGILVERIKRRFPGFLRVKVIECGHPTTLGSSIVFAGGEENERVLQLLDAELVTLADEEKTSLIDIRDIFSSRLDRFGALKALGYRMIPNMANTYLRIYQRSFEEYLQDLTSKRRREIHHRIDVFGEQGCAIEKIEDFASMARDLSDLWRNTYDRAKEYQREVLNDRYFELMSDNLGEKSFVLVCRKGERPIGFTMLIDSGHSLISTYCGLDYEYNRSTYSYFVLFYQSIKEAISLKKEWLELGVTNYNPKIEVGALPEPMYICAKSTRFLLNLILAPVLRAMEAAPDYNKRRVFNQRYYERHAIREEVYVEIAGSMLRLVDLSLEGIGVLSGHKPSKGPVTIRLKVSDGLFMPMSGRMVNTKRVESGRWRTGYSVKPKSPDHLPLWHNFVARYAANTAR